nr:MAG TPA: hypothetical protein [Caudoviricetes sp.]
MLLTPSTGILLKKSALILWVFKNNFTLYMRYIE